jgi:hypothetical protein
LASQKKVPDEPAALKSPVLMAAVVSGGQHGLAAPAFFKKRRFLTWICACNREIKPESKLLGLDMRVD